MNNINPISVIDNNNKLVVGKAEVGSHKVKNE